MIEQLLIIHWLNVLIHVFCSQEPSDSGPLFSELKFYMRAAKPDLSEPTYHSL